MILRQIEQPARRNVINPQAVGPQLAHLLEIFFDLIPRGERHPHPIGRKRAVSHPFDIEFFVTQAEEFAVAANAIGHHLLNALAAMPVC